MNEVLAKEKQRIVEFFTNNKFLFFFISLVTVVTYSAKLFLFSYSIDTDTLITDPVRNLNWWLRIDRYGLVLLKRFTIFGMDVNVPLINMVTYVLLAFSACFLCYLVWRKTEMDAKYLYLASFLYLTSPTMIEQTNFILQSAEVVLSFLFLYTAILSIQLFIESRRSAFLIASILFTIACLSVYPSLQTAFVILSVVSVYFSLPVNEKNRIGAYFGKALPYMLVLGVSMLLNKLISIAVLRVANLEHSPYIRDASLFGKISFSEFIRQVFVTIKTNFFAYNQYFLFVPIVLIAFAVLAMVFDRNNKNKGWTLVTLALVFVMTIFPVLYMGHIGGIRSYAPTVSIALFFLAFLLLKSLEGVKIRVLIYGMLSLFCFMQMKVTADFGATEYIKYQQEVALAQQLKNKFEELNALPVENYKLAIIGTKSFDTNLMLKGDVIGKSDFEWDAGGPVGSTIRSRRFLNSQGIMISEVTPEEYPIAQQAAADMPSYPAEGSVKVVDNIVIVKF